MENKPPAPTERVVSLADILRDVAFRRKTEECHCEQFLNNLQGRHEEHIQNVRERITGAVYAGRRPVVEAVCTYPRGCWFLGDREFAKRCLVVFDENVVKPFERGGFRVTTTLRDDGTPFARFKVRVEWDTSSSS